MTAAGSAPLVPRGLIPGVAIVLIGLLFLADSAGLVDAHSVWAAWPIGVIVAGLAVVLQPGVASRVAGGFLLVAGVWLLLNQAGVWPYAFWRTWPLILMLLGAWLRYRLWSIRQLARTDDAGAIVFLTQDESAPTGRVRRGQLSVIAGDGTIDFTDAIVSGGPIVVEVFALAGRVRVVVPPDWTVRLRVLTLPGRISDTRASASSAAIRQHTDIVIQGSIIGGVLEVANSVTAAPSPVTATV